MKAKELYEYMIDFKRFGILLLTAGAFFYLGVIIPSEKAMLDIYIMMAASTVFLFGSIFFFSFSKKYRKLLMEMEEGQDYLSKK